MRYGRKQPKSNVVFTVFLYFILGIFFFFFFALNFYINFDFLERVSKLFGSSSYLLFCSEQTEQYFSLITDLHFIVLIIM